MKSIAFLGAGNMAGAILRGLLAAGAVAPERVAVLAGAGASAPALARDTGARPATDLADLLTGADVFILACKPQHFAGLDPALAALTAGKLVISVLAGTPNARLRAAFPGARAVVRTMPNTPGRIGAGVTPYTPAEPLTASDRLLVETALGALGDTFEVAEGKMDAVTCASGSGPGFFFEIVAAFEAGAVEAGLTPEEAKRLIRATFIGSAKLLEASGESPEALRNAVTSPNGTTYAGLRALEARDLRGTLAAAQRAARDRSREMARG
jgi:pyrroline-5-carboxylate reductase